MKLPEIKTPQLPPNLEFKFEGKSENFELGEFWRWALSDLVENRNRGILAEFIIKKGLGLVSTTRLEWDAYDLITADNNKIEVKSSAYIQAWEQKEFSKINFGIAPTKTLLKDNSYSEDYRRHADIYIFCLLAHKDQVTINPMNLEQWKFYIVTCQTLDAKLKSQKTLSLSTLESLDHIQCKYDQLKESLKAIKGTIT